MIRRAGFFHFQESHCNPIGALTEVIKAYGDIAGSLIVLPEAFNLGREYDPNDTLKSGPRFDEGSVLEDLQDIAASSDVIFVVSVVQIETRRNSAYFVDAESPRLMCHKIVSDRSQEYAPCTSDCEWENPVVRFPEDGRIGALICADVFDNRSGRCPAPDHVAAFERRKNLGRRLRGQWNIVCVPAYMITSDKNPDTSWVESKSGGSGLVLANSRPYHDSFIKNSDGTRLSPVQGLQNRIHLEELSNIMGEQTMGG